MHWRLGEAIQLTTPGRLCVSTGAVNLLSGEGMKFHRGRLVAYGSFGCNEVEQPARSARYIEFI